MYDGLNIRPLTFAEGKNLSGNIIENIIETENNTLWLQTNYGLDKLDKYKRTITSYTQFQGGYILKKNAEDDIFILSENNNLYYITSTSDEYHKLSIPDLNGNDIIDIHISNNYLWTFTKQGIFQYQLEFSNNQYSIKGVTKVDNTPLLYCFINNDTAYMIDNQYTLYEYRLEHNQKKLAINLSKEIAARGIVSDIIKDDDEYFIAFKTNGVLKLTLQNESYRIEDIGIKSGVFRLLKDRNQDIVWIGTDGQGAYLYSNGHYSIQSITYNNLKFNIAKPIRSIFLDKENSLWLGAKGEDILKIHDYDLNSNTLDYRTELITSANSLLSDNSVYAFAESSHPLFWIGNDEGINYYSYPEKRIKKVPCKEAIKYVHAIYEEHDSVLWISTVGTGIIRARIAGTPTAPQLTDIKRYTIDNGNFSSNYFFTMYCDEQGELCFGNRGYGAFRMKNDRLEPVPLKNNYTDKTTNDVFAIIKTDNTLWLGTSYGLIKQSADKEWCFNKENGLQNSTIHTMQKDNSGNIWIATNGGLERFHINNHEIQSYNRMNGMNIIEFSDGAAFKTKDALFFGGINGLAVIRENPAYRAKSRYTPPIRFTRLNVPGKEQNLYDYIQTNNNGAKLVLNYTQNYFTISFIAMDYIHSNNYSYLYKIDKKGSEWIDNGLSNSISFTQISPGDYTLYVKYKDRTSGEESEVYSINIHVQPPWYLSNTAILAYQILLLTFIIILIRIYMLKQQRKHKQIMFQLEQAHKEEVYEEKLRFFTNITHEFCTPLTLIYGPCERILNYENTDAFIRKYILLIKQNTERLNSLIQEVIDFRRIETGHKIRRIQQLPVSEVCNDIIASFSDIAEQNKIKLENLIETNLLWNSDQSCFTKIVNNLISNAFKYTPIGGTIRITLKTEDGKLYLAVYNTGSGIKKENRSLIFNRYSILDNIEENAVKDLSARNGLGMAICHSMVELLEGEIRIESEVNQYAEFIVTLPELPLSAEKEDRGDIPTSETQPPLVTTPMVGMHINVTPSSQPDEESRKKGQILIIDDNTEILTLLQETLSEYKVVTATSGEDGLELLKKEYPDLIITDVMMPGTDGIELTKQIKQNKHTMHIPLIIPSAKNTNEEKIEGLASGADAYIGKPFNLSYLKASVARLIENYNKIREYYNSSACAYEFSNGQLMKKEDKDFMQSVTEFISTNLENTELSPEDLASHLQISIRNLYRRFKEMEQLPPKDFIKDYRINLAARLLRTTTLTVQEIIYQCGFGNRSHFYKEFDKRFHMAPKEYRSQNKQIDDSLT
ncbi:MAG: response regulator [Bacteroides sp.]|nr:response regulator [Bacteroides sp.]